MNDCRRCKRLACVCEVKRWHLAACPWRCAVVGRVAIACEPHDRDACPKCDRCTCGAHERRRAAVRSEVHAIVLHLWSARRAGDLRDVSECLRVRLFPRAHGLELRRDTAAALRYLKLRGVAGYLRGRGWFPA